MTAGRVPVYHRLDSRRLRVDKTPDSMPKPRVRDAEATGARILDAAKKEFARNGLGGRGSM